MVDQQIALEEAAALGGYQRFIRQFQSSAFSQTSIGNHLMAKSIDDLHDAICELRDNLKGGTYDQYIRALFFCLDPWEIAASVLQTMLNVAYRSLQGRDLMAQGCISSTSIAVGNQLIDLFNYRALNKTNPKAVKWMENWLKDKHSRYKRKTLNWYKEKFLGGNSLRIPPKEKAAIGYHFVKLGIEFTGLFEVHQTYRGVRSLNVLVPSPKVLQRVKDSIDTLSWLHPQTLPMICEPKPWDGPCSGGYYTLRKYILTGHPRESEELWASGHLQTRVPVLNWIQAVPWEIDHDLRRIMEDAYKRGHRAVPVFDFNPEDIPKPWSSHKEFLMYKQTQPEVVAQWKHSMAVMYQKFYNNMAVGQRLSFLRTLSIAKRYESYDTIWFPWRMDYRGRYYPITEGLSPQGDDISKALLRFKRRTPLRPGSEGWQWYQIEGANLMGVDKVPFNERIGFIMKHHDEILKSADDYLSTSWWETADKPWRMLAWCREYARLVRRQQDYTQLPISRDGSCNGLQHLALAMRDEHTGALVNLTPSDRPADIYSNVVAKVEELLPRDSPWVGKVTRKLVKRNTMTTPYNVTLHGMGEQLLDELRAATVDGVISPEEARKAMELREYNYRAIQALLGKTAELMRWYSKVAHEYMKRDLRIEWVLPDGFKVIQDLRKLKSRRIQLEYAKVTLQIKEECRRLDSRRNISALAPNVTHSMDATHMTMFIRSIMSKDPECPFSGVHDSFGLPGPRSTTLGEDIVPTLVNLYETYDIIEAIRQDFRSKTGEELPAPPDKGDLRLSDTLRSIYAFA